MDALLHQTSMVFVIFVIILFFNLQTFCMCFNPKMLNVTEIDSAWFFGGATWYGSPNGAGSDGGACGYGKAVREVPFNSLIAAGGPSLFQSGHGCGICYQVKCTGNAACSGKPVTVVITDECPGGPCQSESAHFDLSGAAFGAMASSGRADQLRNVGVLQIQYHRIACNYLGVTVTFRIDAGSNPYYFSTVVEYLNGDGNLASMELQEASNKNKWHSMQRLWGAVWKLNSGSELRAPFSIRLKADQSRAVLVAKDVIPRGWETGATYRSHVNF